MGSNVEKTDDEWKKSLTPEQYKILRKKHTEVAFTGKLLHHKGVGVYKCAGCGNVLFASEAKFDSGTGWPSFNRPAAEDSVKLEEDRSWGMRRTEVLCSRCGGHLGHLFDDGPPPTEKRYCINSGALEFEEQRR